MVTTWVVFKICDAVKKQFALLFFVAQVIFCLPAQDLVWTSEGHSYCQQSGGQIVRVDLPGNTETPLVTAAQLTPEGAAAPLRLRRFSFSEDGQKLLIFTNTKRVWRYDTRGNYWVLDLKTNVLRQLGKELPASSLMFAKISPDGQKAAYVSEHNLYVEDLATATVTQLTETDGKRKLINGTFDWVYEEEFDCRDGFRWSPDSKRIAYWQIDAEQIRDFLMINTTDSIYPFTVPVEYPKVGEPPSPYRIGVVDIAYGKTQWMAIPGDPRNTYLPRMEWAANASELLVQQLNRKQNESRLMLCDAGTGAVRTIYTETDEAWIDLNDDGEKGYWDWLDKGQAFLWTSEKDGWRHIYRISRDGKTETLLTPGNFDVISLERIDAAGGYLYFMASPDNATQRYLYRIRMNGKDRPERLSPAGQQGTHSYQIAPDAQYALHSFSNYYTRPQREWLRLPGHKALDAKEAIPTEIEKPVGNNTEFFQVTTVDGVTMDGWLVKPDNFDPSKKYPIVFYVYSEPAGATVTDRYGIGRNRLYDGDMAKDGYIYASLDGRGTPAPKGRAWRKAIYRKIGIVNIRDQAMGAKAMFERWHWIDTSRVAVHGWSGGGTATLNLLFQYPEVYQTGISVAAVANQLSYDNIYQERYMGLPQENLEDFVNGSPITHAKNLRGNLLYIHGTGDDNVHYQNAELLINELIKYNKYFQVMPYPNRSHSIREGEGTSRHLSTMFTRFLRENCPPGGKLTTP
ncbi:MAG: S9 family peptidase [Saprospiraceae bacterium]|nr:S9 family peptidase [Saprospiraceae bacterium]